VASEKQAPYLFDLATGFADYITTLGFDHSKYVTVDDIRQNMPAGTASQLISQVLEYSKQNWPWKPLSRQTVAAELAYQFCKDRGLKMLRASSYDAIIVVARQIGFQSDFRPLVFSKNVNGERVPLTNYEAEDAFRKQLSAIKEYVNKRLAAMDDDKHKHDNDEQKFKQRENHDQLREELGLKEEKIEDDPEPYVEIEEEPESEIGNLGETFWERYVFLREFTETRDVGGHQIDTIERRPYIAGASMLKQGIPVEAIFDAMTMHWPADVRRDLSITEYNVQAFKSDHEKPNGMPPEFHYLMALIHARVNPWLISAAGVGKTTIVKKLAQHLGQPWCMIPLNRGTSPSAFNGRPKLTNTSMMIRYMRAAGAADEELMKKIATEAENSGDVAISEFVKVFAGGGHILLDEIDAGDENLLMMVNAPLANGVFANTAEGKTYAIHPDTTIWAASNTMGLGVSAGQGREYRGRNALDFATIDRFRMGRVKMKGSIDEYRKHFESIMLADQ
jgi:hypothetical protein